MSTSIRNTIETQYNVCKQNLMIVILGSYEPPENKQRLIEFKNSLIAAGYAKATLVEDYPDDLIPGLLTSTPERIYVKSMHLCQISHCNFVVATHDGAGIGWVNELTYCCRNCPNGVVKTTVFDEQRDSQSALGIVNLGMVSLHNMAYEHFSNIDELKSAGERTAFRYLIRLLDKLVQSQ